MQPKTPKRRSAFRRANRPMPRRRIDIALEAIDYKNPDLAEEICHGERQNSSPSHYRHARIHAPENHAGDQAQPIGAVNEVVVEALVPSAWSVLTRFDSM